MVNQSFFRIKKENKNTIQNAALQPDYDVRNEDIFSSYLDRINRRRRYIWIGVVLLLASSAGVSFLFRQNQQKNFDATASIAKAAEEIARDETTQSTESVFVNDGAKTEDVLSTKKDETIAAAGTLASENYRARAVSFGESANVFTNSDEIIALAVSDVRSETMTNRSGDEIKVVISWKTNKLAKSEVTYVAGTTGDSRKFSEDEFGYSHAVVLSKLQSGQRYTYTIKATDRWENSASSEQFSIFIGSKPVSVFELISAEFENLFGWARKKTK